MDDKNVKTTPPLISTFEKASSPNSVSPEKKEEEEKRKEKQKDEIISRKREPSMSKKRKIEKTLSIDRPNTLETAKRAKPAEKEQAEPSTSAKSNNSINDWSDDEYEIPAFTPKRRFYPSQELEREPSITESNPLSIWTPEDDLALITAVQHVSCVKFVHRTLQFSRKYTFEDLEERFCQIMYDEKMAEEAKARMARIPFRKVLQIQSRVPFTRKEEKVLTDAAEYKLKQMSDVKGEKDISVHTMLRMPHFKTILDENRAVFHVARTPQVLSDHFRRIKGWNEQARDSCEDLETPNPWGMDEPVDVFVPLKACRARYHSIARKPALRGILSRFQGTSVPDNAYAVIRGQFLSYSMTTMEALMGRSAQNSKVDIDLSIEGPACKVSRQQAIIKQSQEGTFTIQNIGQRPMYIDCKPLPQMVSTSLKNGSIIEVAAIRLVFSIPVPRVLHPLTRQSVQAYRKQQLDNAPKPSYQQYQKQTSTAAKKMRVISRNPVSNSMHSVIRSATPNEHDRLLKAVIGGGAGF